MIGYGWSRTRNINVAAALFACGVKVLPISALDEHTGVRITEFHIRDEGFLPAAVIPEEDGRQVRARFNLFHGKQAELRMVSGAVRHGLETGGMEDADPEHPALDVLRVLEARECLLSFMNRGERYRVQVSALAARARYVRGQEPLFTRMGEAGFATWDTKDLAIAAAVSRIGCPVIDIRGAGKDRCFVLPRFGHGLPGRPGPEDARAIVEAFHDGELERQCPEHPVVWGYYGCKARLMLLKAIEGKGACNQVLQYHRRSRAWQRKGRSVLVGEWAKGEAFEQADRFLKRR